MKKLLTLSAAIACSIGTHAQQAHKPVSHLRPAMKAAPADRTPAKTTSADSRLIASANFTYGASAFVPDDSGTVSYTGNNGWDYATEGWKFDSAKVWTYVTSSSSWDQDGRASQVLTNNRIMSTLFEKLVGSVWQDEQKTSYAYINGLIQTQVFEFDNGTGMAPTSRLTNTYNGDMQVTENQQENWSSNQWQKSSRTVNHYNTAKQMDTSWQSNWIQMTGQWYDYSRNLYTYNNGRLTELRQQSFAGAGMWDDSYRTLYTYDAAGNQTVVENEQWNGTSAAWDKMFRSEFSYNTAGDVTEEKFANWNGSWQYSTKTTYTYNQFRRVLTEETQSWNNTTSQWYYDTGNDYLTRNHYEPYTNSVKTVTSNIALLNLFPLPAKEQLNLSASFTQAQPVAISIIDMNGRVVKQFAEQAGMQYRKRIDVSDIPAGNYIINVSGTTEQAAKAISIVR